MDNTVKQHHTFNKQGTYLADLNAVQQSAVVNTEGPFMVIAGAGSGKTKVLTSRIAYVLQTGKAQPYQILALTFTNKAAFEMRHRIESVVGRQVKDLWLGTFHSVFTKLLRCEAQVLGYPSNFSIYDTEDSKSLLKHIVKILSLDDKVYKVDLLLYLISYLKNRLITPETYNTDANNYVEDHRYRIPRFSEVFLYYVNMCKQAGAMDFDDLLVQTYKLLCGNKEVCSKYQKRFLYCFIDEFQDTNVVQYNIVKKIAELNKNICVVGDDAQSIYAFRGANIGNILNFSKDYPECHVAKLEQNYRSSMQIVEASNRVIGYNSTQLEKKIWTANDPGDPIDVLMASTDVEEGQLVVESLLRHKLTCRLGYQDFAILYRTNNQSRGFEEILRKNNIPYRIMGGLSFYQRKEIKDFLAYLRFIVNRNDIEAFKRIINYPKRGIGPATIQKIINTLDERGVVLWDVLSNLSSFAIVKANSRAPIEHFVSLIQMAAAKLEVSKENAHTIAMHVAHQFGLLKELYVDKTAEGLMRYEHMQELLNSIKQFVDDPQNDDPSLGNFLQSVALMTNGDQDQEDHQDAVSLMTVHAAKGLEFPYVYLVGIEEDIFPSSRMLTCKEDLEEERRLFYVAITRAKTKLILSYALSRYRYGKSYFMKPSRFLREALPDTTISDRSCDLDQGPTRINTQHVVIDEYQRLEIGMQVKHVKFGVGYVTDIVDQSDRQKVMVLFDRYGLKNLLTKYAKLEIVKS